MAGIMDAIEGMVECVWWIVGDGLLGSADVVVFDLEASVMMVVMMLMMREVVAMAHQWSLYLCLPSTNTTMLNRALMPMMLCALFLATNKM